MGAIDKFTGALGRKNALHLLRRSTFGFSNSDLDQFENYTIDQALDVLFAETDPPDLPIDLLTNETWLNPSAGAHNSESSTLMDYFVIWHLEQMRKSGTHIRERLTYFLHSHLPVRRSLVDSSEMIYYQNALYRYYALGSFKDMFKRICKDNAMLIYLDNRTNDISSPNENFAREMFELYSIGRGNQIAQGDYTYYTEDDIKAATRILTGYEVDDTFLNIDDDTLLPTGKLKTTTVGESIIAHRHDAGDKVFSYHFDNKVISPIELIDGKATVEAAHEELAELIEMIFEKDATALFLTRKLYRFFIYYKIDDAIESQVIQPLAKIFKEADYDLSVLVKTMLGSKHFFDVDDSSTQNNIRGSIIKSPMELMWGACNLFEVVFPEERSALFNNVYIDGIFKFLEDQGINFYEPFEVAGYPAYHQFPVYSRAWITPQSLAYRYKFADLLINGVNNSNQALGIQLDVLSWVNNSGAIIDPSDAALLVDTLVELMIPFDIATERREFFLTTIFLDDLYPAAWAEEWNNYISNPSSYEATVKSRIEILVNAIMQSPEYQLY